MVSSSQGNRSRSNSSPANEGWSSRLCDLPSPCPPVSTPVTYTHAATVCLLHERDVSNEAGS